MRLLRSRFFLLFVVPHVAIVLLMTVTRNATLTGVFNVVNFALAVMVVVAYFSVVVDVLRSSRPLRDVDRAEWLCYGIFVAWFSTIILRAYSMAWRWLGQPQWLTDSDILNYALFVQFCAGVMHLAAPEAINRRVPTRQWVRIGIYAGLAVLLAIVLGYFFDAGAVDILNLDPYR